MINQGLFLNWLVLKMLILFKILYSKINFLYIYLYMDNYLTQVPPVTTNLTNIFLGVLVVIGIILVIRLMTSSTEVQATTTTPQVQTIIPSMITPQVQAMAMMPSTTTTPQIQTTTPQVQAMATTPLTTTPQVQAMATTATTPTITTAEITTMMPTTTTPKVQTTITPTVFTFTPPSQTKAWNCITKDGMNWTPIRIGSTGQTECASKDGKNCLSNNSQMTCSAFDQTNLTPKICSSNEYDTIGSVCGLREQEPHDYVYIKGNKGYCTDFDNGIRCNANKTVGQSEKFIVKNMGNNKITLQGGRVGKFCTDQLTNVMCNIDSPASWEEFTYESKGGNNIVLRGGQAGKICGEDGDGVLRCNKDVENESTLFKFE